MTNSVFDDNQNGQPAKVETNVQANSNSADDTYNQLVGEGKKFKDNEALAKSKVESDAFIETLKAELKASREGSITKEEVDQRLNEFTTKLNEQNKPNASRSQTDSALDADKIAEIVRNTITSTEQVKTAQQNITAAEKAIVAKYGDKTKEFLDSKAAELGMTRADFKDISAKSPSALLKIVGLDAPATANTGVTKGSVNTQASFNNTNPSADTWEYYQTLRKANPSKYYDSAIQLEIEQKVATGRLVLPN
jgi:hypothetical protein